MPKPKKIAEHKLPSLEIDNPMADVEYRECLAMFCMGFTAAEIKQRSGVSNDRINLWVHRHKWVEQKEAMQAAFNAKNPPGKSPLLNAVASSRKDELKKKFCENMGEIASEDAEHWKQMSPEERMTAAPAITGLAGLHRKTFDLDKEQESQERGHISLTFLTNASQDGMVRMLEPGKVKEIPASGE